MKREFEKDRKILNSISKGAFVLLSKMGNFITILLQRSKSVNRSSKADLA